MAKEKLENLSIEQLSKKKRFASIIVGLLVGIFLLSMIILVLKSMDTGEWGNSSTLVPGLACLVIALPMIIGIKNINLELKKRKTH